jgi:flagellum-specific ATP synthase
VSYVSATHILQKLTRAKTAVINPYRIQGELTKIVGLALEAKGCRGSIGSRFQITSEHHVSTEAELIGFEGDVSYLLPLDYSRGLLPGSRVIPFTNNSEIAVGYGLLGRVVDANNQPIDQLGPLALSEKYPLYGKRINPLDRDLITEPLDVGVRVINGLLTVGKGQRIGLFAGTGVGKSVLLGMITRATQADVVVIALVGERGREVREFIDKTLTKDALKKSVIVATPADDPPLFRYQGALTAMTIAEYFRDQGKDVLLIMDSLTRFAHAQREIALSIGEPPASRGYPPSVFTKLPNLVERGGRLKNSGSITGIYTVLTEGDDLNDPIADASRGILDGHIILSRDLADQGIYPAVSVLSSISRIMPDIISSDHQSAAALFKKLYATYAQQEDLINIGAYKKGNNPEIDQAMHFLPALKKYIQQSPNEMQNFQQSEQELMSIFK